jgi:hypothetical protein
MLIIYHFPISIFIEIAPQFFQTVLDFMRPFMSAATRRDLKIYRNDKAVWGPAILKIIPANQLTPQYGGTKKG